jgi:hypothetical protein
MKMCTTRLLCPYDAVARHALLSAYLPQPAILMGGCFPEFAGWSEFNKEMEPALMHLVQNRVHRTIGPKVGINDRVECPFQTTIGRIENVGIPITISK